MSLSELCAVYLKLQKIGTNSIDGNTPPSFFSDCFKFQQAIFVKFACPHSYVHAPVNKVD